MPETDLLLQGVTPAHQNAGDGSAWIQEMGVYARRVDLTVVGAVTTIYKGWADYGSLDSAPVWRIQKIVLDETVGLVLTDGQAGTGAFDQIYDDRAILVFN